MSRDTRSAIHYSDTLGGDPVIIGPFETRQLALDWMFNFADTKCEGCDITKEVKDGFEHVEIVHDSGEEARMFVVSFESPEAFLANWNV